MTPLLPVTDHHTRHNTIQGLMGLGNGLVPSGNKPLPEPVLAQMRAAIRW